MANIKDNSGMTGCPTEVFAAKNPDELIDFLKKNPDSKFRIGAGLSGVSGAAVPLSNEIYIDFSRYKSLSWIDKAEGVFSSAVGNTMFEIKNFVETEGWHFPVLPGSMHKATIGGMIACNGGGPYSLRYGKIGNFIRGLEIITVKAEVINFGSVCKKLSEGPDFTKLFIGSEGSLAFMSSAILQCIKMPEVELYRIAHPSFYELSGAISKFLQYNPLYLEMAESDALRFSSGANESVIWLGLQKGSNFDAKNHGNLEIKTLSADSINERFDIGLNLQEYKKFVDLDISFPLNNSTKLLSALKNLLESHGLESAFFGHAGDGNWHIHIFYEDENQFKDEISTAFDELLFSYGGHISGEHGLGRIHKQRFVRFKDKHYKALYLTLKAHLDPKNQLPSLF